MAAGAAEGAFPPPGGAAAASWATEWSTAYTDYLRRAAESSARTFELYQRVADHVARQELAPTASQDLLASFVRERGPAWSEQLGELSRRYFSEMVRIGTAYGRELGRAVAPGAPAAPSPPPFDPSDPARWYADLADYSQRLAADAAAAYRTLLDDVAAGRVAPDEVRRTGSEYLERRLPEYLAELGRLYFALLNGLNDLRAGSEQEFLAGVLATVPGSDGEAFALALRAPLGDTATATVSVANTREERARIRCHVTEVRRADGVGPAFAPAVAIVPEAPELAPGEEALLSVTLPLAEGVYDPERLYVGALLVSGGAEPRLEVPLRITAVRPAPATAPP